MIVGTDLMQELGIDVKFSDNTIMWDDATVPMQNCKLFNDDVFRNKKYEEYFETNSV